MGSNHRLPVFLVSAALLSGIVANTAAIAQWRRSVEKIEGCAEPRQIIEAEAFRAGVSYKDSHVFRGPDAMFLSRAIGMAFPGSSTVVMVSYSSGDAAILSQVPAPECWRREDLGRRK